MFYIFEILKRINYFAFSYFFLLCVCYIYYDTFFSFLDFLFKKLLNEQNNNVLNYYIYTHPFELYYTHLFFGFILSLYGITPYICWQLIDFNKYEIIVMKRNNSQLYRYTSDILFQDINYIFFRIKK